MSANTLTFTVVGLMYFVFCDESMYCVRNYQWSEECVLWLNKTEPPHWLDGGEPPWLYPMGPVDQSDHKV